MHTHFSGDSEANPREHVLQAIKMNLDEEEMLLAALKDSLNRRKHLANDKIATQLHILISEYILDPSGKKNEKYIEAINQLRRIS